MSSKVPDIYSFFYDYITYKKYEVYIEKHSGTGIHNNTCNVFNHDVPISSTESANNICATFKNLYKFIHTTKKSTRSEYLDNNDFAYLNYWLNSKLKNNTLRHSITVKEFHEKMSNHEWDFVSGIFDGILYDLGEDDFTNMNLLNNLEINYSEIYENIISRIEKQGKISCLGYYQKYFNIYKEGIKRCPNNTNFCNVLNIYKKKYESFSDPKTISEKCIDEMIPKLPTYNHISLGDQKFTVIGTILGPSFGMFFTLVFLYKFTPFGQWILSKIGKNKITHSNLYEKNNQLLLDTSDNVHINSAHNSYSISYDSAVNS
ncbi:PIR protein [Plasmodium ovale]|uniref:PIR protein n=1 Tax=Plasmodium ovale TaxID=36330 RepID=A0A1D3JBZ3_PLAOA|nr:PIR protein [Plasmodium ovale]